MCETHNTANFQLFYDRSSTQFSIVSHFNTFLCKIRKKALLQHRSKLGRRRRRSVMGCAGGRERDCTAKRERWRRCRAQISSQNTASAYGVRCTENWTGKYVVLRGGRKQKKKKLELKEKSRFFSLLVRLLLCIRTFDLFLITYEFNWIP